MSTHSGPIGLTFLQNAPYGVYAVDTDQSIQLWNRAAELITGHRSGEVVGRHCYEVLFNLFEDSSKPVCSYGCPSLATVKDGRIPDPFQVWILCASGHRKRVMITPIVMPVGSFGTVAVVHLFREAETSGQETRDRANAHRPGQSPLLTAREIEVLHLTALGLTPWEIGQRLQVSYHTVRNHISNIRRKLDAPNKLDMVRTGRELGLI